MFSEDDLDWNDPATLTRRRPAVREPGWTWHQPDRVVTAPTWGGNLEILHWNLAADRWIRPVDDYAGCVLLLETSEEMPTARGGVPDAAQHRASAACWRSSRRSWSARAKATASSVRRSPSSGTRTAAEQRAAVLRALQRYHPGAMVVFDVDFGHTDPQWVLPYGGRLTVDGPARTITAHY